MHTDKSPFDDSNYSSEEKKAALDYAQKKNILFLQKKTVGNKRKDVMPANNPYAKKDESAHKTVEQFGVTNHEDEDYQTYLKALPVGRTAMLRVIQEAWDEYQAQVVALEGTLEKIDLADEEAQQRALEQRAGYYATRVILGPDGESQDYQAVYDQFLLAEPDLREALEQSVADISLSEEPHAAPMTAVVPPTTINNPEDIDLLAADYADRLAAHCTTVKNKDDWFERAYGEYINAEPEKRIELITKLEALEARLGTSSNPQHATRHVPPLSFSSSSPPANQAAQRIDVEEYVARAKRVMPYLNEEELKQNYQSASQSGEVAGLIETLQELESEDPRYRGGRGWR